MAEIAVKLALSKGESLLGMAFDKVYATISGELSLLQGVRGEIQRIMDEMEIMSAFLRDAEENQMKNEAAKAWVRQVKQLAYEVEDCIDDFSLHLKQEGTSHNYVVAAWRRLALMLGSLGARHRIASNLQGIRTRVEEVSNRRIRYAITNLSNTSGDDEDNVGFDPRDANFVKDSQIVGIEEPRRKLVRWLADDDELRLSLIAVVGQGGIGKTTLVKKAYGSPEVINSFSCRAWVAVSQVYHVQSLLKDIFRQVTGGTSTIEDVNITNRLKEYLAEKRYIICLDDIWDTDAWDFLLLALPENNKGSRVILTTRNKNVAEACLNKVSAGNIYEHQALNLDNSMDLFCRLVFKIPDQHGCPDEFKEPTENILSKCDGLPLAIVSVAGVLACKPNKSTEEWNDLVHRLGSELEYNPNLRRMNRILNLSYNDLPYHIKRCYLYLSKYPEDHLIERKCIIRLWTAEGLAVCRRDMTAEQVAESYFNELIRRYMILPSTFSTKGKVKSFRVHDISVEVMVKRALEENFMTLPGEISEWMPQDVVRRISVHQQHKLENMRLPHVRSLSLFGEGTDQFVSPSLGLLRVLDLAGCRTFGQNQVNIIMNFPHLKYLSLASTKVKKLPKSLGNLRNLETFDFRGTYISKIPEGIIKLKKLRFLHGTFHKLPSRIGELRALQVLISVNLQDSSRDAVKELRKLSNLRKLRVFGIHKWMEKDFCKALSAMSGSLRSLGADGESLSFMDDITTSPPLLLESLVLDNWGRDFSDKVTQVPGWIYSLKNLVKLHLRGLNVLEDGVKSLGALPCLIKLKLGGPICYERERLSFGSGGFPSLKVLSLSKLELKLLTFEGMCKVESITIGGCYGHESRRVIVQGIANLPSLKEINITTFIHREDLDIIKEQVDQHPEHPRLTADSVFADED